jgi:hypothetical protein
MIGLLVQIKGSRRHWRVVHDTGRYVILKWREGPPRIVPRTEITKRREPSVGWVPCQWEE